MYKAINGWTKKAILKVLRARRYNCASYDKVDQVCLYTSPNGNRCAIGMFIPKKHEASGSLGNVYDMLTNFPDLVKHMPIEKNGLGEFQGVHDDFKNRSNAKQAMIEWVKKNVS